MGADAAALLFVSAFRWLLMAVAASGTAGLPKAAGTGLIACVAKQCAKYSTTRLFARRQISTRSALQVLLLMAVACSPGTHEAA